MTADMASRKVAISLWITMVVVAEGGSGRPDVGSLRCPPKGCEGRILRVPEGLENDYRVSIPGKNHEAQMKRCEAQQCGLHRGGGGSRYK